MTFELAQRGTLENTSSRLELEFASWSGSWEEFLIHVRSRDDPDEVAVLEFAPERFEHHALTRRERVRNWGDNRLAGLLENMHSLATGAMKTQKDGKDLVEVEDNNVRLSATRFLLEQILEKKPVVGGAPLLPAGGSTEDAQGRVAAIDKELKQRGGKVTETTTTVERSIEVNSATPE